MCSNVAAMLSHARRLVLHVHSGVARQLAEGARGDACVRSFCNML